MNMSYGSKPGESHPVVVAQYPHNGNFINGRFFHPSVRPFVNKFDLATCRPRSPKQTVTKNPTQEFALQAAPSLVFFHQPQNPELQLLTENLSSLSIVSPGGIDNSRRNPEFLMNKENGIQQEFPNAARQSKQHIDPSLYFSHLSDINDCNMNTDLDSAMFFVIKSYVEDDVHKAIKYNVWSSTKEGNRKLDFAFRQANGQCPVYLIFSVNGSGRFLGIAQMVSGVDFSSKFGYWAQKGKWEGQFHIKWIYIKDIPNKDFRHITIEANENKPVTNSRDTQEVPQKEGCQMLAMFRDYPISSSIFDDFQYYESKQQEAESKRYKKTFCKKKKRTTAPFF